MRRLAVVATLAWALSLTAASVAGADPGPPSKVSPPVISGSRLLGSTVTASPGTWNGAEPMTFAYRWYRCAAGATAMAGCAALTGYQASNTYTLAREDVYRRVLVEVRATNSVSYAYASSAPFGDVTTPCGLYCQVVGDTPGLVDYWRLDDPSPSGSGCAPAPVFDRKRGQVVGSACNNPSSMQVPGATSDDAGLAMAFDNYYGPGYFGLTATPDLDVSGVKPYTFEFFVQPHTDYGIGSLIAAGDALSVTSGNYWGGNGLTFNRAGAYRDSTLCMGRDTWGHVALTYDGTTLRAYCNGAELGTVASTTSIAATTHYRFFSAQAAFDELAVYDRALTASEIATHYTKR